MEEQQKIRSMISLSFSGELARRIRPIYHRLGYRSITAFVESAVREILPREERRFEEIEEAIKHGRVDPSNENW